MTTIIIPGDRILVPGTQIVPAIEADLGRSWHQPSRQEISFEVKEDVAGAYEKADVFHAYMSQACMQQLSEYDTSMPTGVYPGKMWRRHEEDTRYLVWFGEVKDQPTMCSVWAVPIILTDLLDLLNPAGKERPMPF